MIENNSCKNAGEYIVNSGIGIRVRGRIGLTIDRLGKGRLLEV